MYQIFFHPKIKKDLTKVSIKDRNILHGVISEKISVKPEVFGKPLRYGLKKYRTTRISKYRVVFKIKGKNIYILAIGHRQDIYKQIIKRD